MKRFFVFNIWGREIKEGEFQQILVICNTYIEAETKLVNNSGVEFEYYEFYDESYYDGFLI